MFILDSMIQRALISSGDSLEQTVLQSAVACRNELPDLSLQEFLERAHLSRSSFYRYLKSLCVESYADWRCSFLQEWASLLLQRPSCTCMPAEPHVLQMLKEARIIVFCGTIDFTSIVQAYASFLIAAGKQVLLCPMISVHKEWLKDNHIGPDDLIICGSACYTSEEIIVRNTRQFCQSRLRWPNDYAYPVRLIFIGMPDLYFNSRIDFHYPLRRDGSYSDRLAEIAGFFDQYLPWLLDSLPEFH